MKGTLTLDEYQVRARATDKGTTLMTEDGRAIHGLYNALGMCGEAGECAEKIKKFARDNTESVATQEAIKKELGDVLWYVAGVARNWGLSLEEVAYGNLDKIASRKARGVLHGSGDDR